MATTKPVEYPVPRNAEEKTALIKALAQATKNELDPILAFLDAAETKAFAAKVEELSAAELPAGSATRSNLTMLATFLPAMRRAVEAEIEAAENTINPPPPPGASLDPALGGASPPPPVIP